MLGKDDFKLVVVQLESCDIPKLLSHRLWAGGESPLELAQFFSKWLGHMKTEEKGTEIHDFIQAIDERTLERLALTIADRLNADGLKNTIEFSFDTKQFNKTIIRLVTPITETLHDELRFNLQMIKTHEFIRQELKIKIMEEGLGLFEPAFKLRLQKKITELESSRQDLKDTVDALVAVVLQHDV
jgi:hypothetical protein